MKFLHTSDWHLGQRFLYADREEEHAKALAWLSQTIRDQQIDCLIVAGDVFDINNPPNYARSLYYQFLTGLLGSCCRHVVITGGNHDSPSMLNAPRDLLRVLNIHVVGAGTGNPEEEIIELRSKNGDMEAVIAAVPFLRDRDLRNSEAGEGGLARLEKIREGLVLHYAQIAELVGERYALLGVPLIATGHLFATGAQASERQDNIYAGNMENIDAGQFPPLFDYLALGHIHRAQAVGGIPRVRYSGSLIPLSFSETKDEKSVTILEFHGRDLVSMQTPAVPVFRRLKTIRGSFQEVKEALRRFDQKGGRALKPWVELVVDTDKVIPQLDMQLRDFSREMNLEILKIRVNRQYAPLDRQLQDEPDLSELDVMEVFRKKCESFGSPPEQSQELEKSFRELQEWMTDQEF